MEETKAAVLDILKRAGERPVTRSEISMACDISDRAARRAIEGLRNDHYPIGNAAIGYTYGQNDGLKKTIADMRSKALKLMTTAAALEKCLTIDGQEVMDV